MAQKVVLVRRENAVVIRKSGDAQNEAPQIANVKRMLEHLGASVSPDYWFYPGKGVRRSQAAHDVEINRLMDLVREDRIDTIYIEFQDRWGSTKTSEYFSRLEVLREHGTKLWDLTDNKDLSKDDIVTEITGVLGTHESKKELMKISRRSLRTKVNELKDQNAWPSGSAPFGYGKACYSRDGKLLWTWHPSSRIRGQQFFVGNNGELAPGPSDIRIPARSKSKSEKPVIRLVPHNDRRIVETVQMIFGMFTSQNISCRQIAIKLNAEGRTYYGAPFNHSLIMLILRNPAYAGDTRFGKTQSGEYYTRASSGVIVEQTKEHAGVLRRRTEAERQVQKGTHTGLITEKTW
jgi:hypothetical protein